MSSLKKIGKVKIEDNKYVYKEEIELNNLYNYLLSRDFKYFNPLLNRDNNCNKYEYIKDYSSNNYQKGEDIAYIVSELHKKTSYNKEVNINDYNSIYDNNLGYINYLEDYYLNILNEFELIEYPSPSNLLFLSNYSKLNQLFIFLKDEINNWFNMIKNNNIARVVLNHGNLKLEHLIKNNNNNYLISWGKNKVDSPIMDIIVFYHNDWDKIDFSSFLKIYLDNFKLSDEELKLLLINICIPLKIEFNLSEIDNCNNVRKLYDYIYKCEELIRPYYSK